VEDALQVMENVTPASNDHINIDTFKAGEDIILQTISKLYNIRKANTHSMEER